MRRLAVTLLIGLTAVSCSGAAKTPSGHTAATRAASVGEKVGLPGGDSVKVYSYAPDISPSNPFSKAQPGTSFSAIDVDGCAGGQRRDAGVVNPFEFTLLMPDGSRVQTSIPVKDPGLNVVPLDPGACIRGFVTFETPSGATPKAVVLEAGGTTVTWRVRPS